MYGLKSESERIERQRQWVREIELSIHNNPVVALVGRGKANTIKDENITILDSSLHREELNDIHSEINELKIRLTNAEKLNLYLKERIIQLETISKKDKTIVDDDLDDDDQELQCYIPVFIDEDYTSKVNKTVLNSNHLKMELQIIGRYASDNFIIYPFGCRRISRIFQEQECQLTIPEIEMTFRAVLNRDHRNYYYLDCSDPLISGEVVLPVTIKIDMDLA